LKRHKGFTALEEGIQALEQFNKAHKPYSSLEGIEALLQFKKLYRPYSTLKRHTDLTTL